MNRRDFLRRSLFAVASWPVLVQTGFAGDSPVVDLAHAATGARDAGRDLLVFVIPHEDDRWDRGHALGAFLNHGSPATLARLSQAEVLCATREDLATLTRAEIPPQAAMARVHLTSVPATVSTQPLVLAPLDLWGWSEDETWEERQGRENALVRARIEAVEAAITTLFPAPAGNVTAALDDVRERIVAVPPTGAEWARSTGCGTIVEGRDDQMRVGCGMGHVPALTSRFLLFASEA